VRTTSLLTALLAVPVTGLAANAKPANSIAVAVRETAGIRRGNYPTQAQVQLARGAVQENCATDWTPTDQRRLDP
jgi:hypothetical protein